MAIRIVRSPVPLTAWHGRHTKRPAAFAEIPERIRPHVRLVSGAPTVPFASGLRPVPESRQRSQAMKRRSVVTLGLLAVGSCALALGLRAAQDPARPAADPAAPAAPALKIAPSRVTHVTVYQTNALITREVE